MKKRISLLLCLAFLLLAAALPAGASELPPVDLAQPCSLTLHYDQGDNGFSGLAIRIYRVAAFSADGSYALTGVFSGYPVKIHDITAQQEWRDVARTLASWVDADGLEATALGYTDDTGTVAFPALETGLYLVMGAEGETENSRCRFEDFLIFLPTPDENGAPDYDREAEPKPVEITPISRYKVVKLWKDSADPARRPADITLEILRDGELYETVTLNPENNWSYSWETGDTDSRWTVAEREVPAGYTVEIELKGDTFFITNTLPSAPQDPPETGDEALPGVWITAALLSGAALCTGFGRRRV